MSKFNFDVDFSRATQLDIEEAITVIRKGICKRVDTKKGVKVYDCGGVIRIDLKKEAPDEAE